MNESPDHQPLLDLEHEFWTTGGGNPQFWSRHFDDDGIVALPIGIMDKPQTIAAMRQGQPWTRATLDDIHVTELAGGAIALTYRATAHREGDDTDYLAVVSSVYVRREDQWLLVLHQQTPTTES